MVKFSVVMPIKDEIDILKFSLASIYALEPDEVIIPAEPFPESIEMVERIARKCGYLEKTRILVLHEKTPDWRFRQAYARRKGFQVARNDIILTVDADIIIDHRIKRYLGLVGKNDIGLVSFGKFPYPLTFARMMARLIQIAYRHHSFTGLYAFSKEAWEETEDIESLKEISRGEDTHLHEDLTKKYRDTFIPSVRNIVLRPKESKRYQYLAGWNRWKTMKTELWRMLISTFLYFRPNMMVGYLKARCGETSSEPT